MAMLEIKTTPINCISCACALVEAYDDAMCDADPVVDRIADMAKTSLAALLAAAQKSDGVSVTERGCVIETMLEGCEVA